MSDPLVIIPARTGSKGIPNKNFRLLAGKTPAQRAIDVVRQAGWEPILSTDCVYGCEIVADWCVMLRPAELAQDDTPMLAVIQHVLAKIPGPPDQPILLVQPTQVLREAKHLTQALEALTSDWDSVVTLAPIPRSHAPEFVVWYENVTLQACAEWTKRPTRRQDVRWPYVCDGTAYVFRRKTVEEFGNIYGDYVRAILMDPEETCSLDTPADWAEAERRLLAREG